MYREEKWVRKRVRTLAAFARVAAWRAEEWPHLFASASSSWEVVASWMRTVASWASYSTSGEGAVSPE